MTLRDQFAHLLRRNGYPSLGNVLRRRGRTSADFLREQGVTTPSEARDLLLRLIKDPMGLSYEDDFFCAIEGLESEAVFSPPEEKIEQKSPEVSTKRKKPKQSALAEEDEVGVSSLEESASDNRESNQAN